MIDTDVRDEATRVQAPTLVLHLDGDRIAFDAAELLEIGELGDLHAVAPDLPGMGMPST